MSGKLLCVITSGPENVNKVSWGLRMALNTYTHPYGEKILDDIRVLLFCDGVKVVDPSTPHYGEYRDRLIDLRKVGIDVASFTLIAEPLGLVKDTESLGIELVHTSEYVARSISEGFTALTF
jgi:hypothetical protein